MIQPIRNQIIQVGVADYQRGNLVTSGVYEYITNLLNNTDYDKLPYGSLNDKDVMYTDGIGMTYSIHIIDAVPCTPDIIIMDGDYQLVENRDYTVAYHNNDNLGTASAVVLGMGAYSGSQIAQDYEIVGYAPAPVTVDEAGKLQYSWGTSMTWTPNLSLLEDRYSHMTFGTLVLKREVNGRFDGGFTTYEVQNQNKQIPQFSEIISDPLALRPGVNNSDPDDPDYISMVPDAHLREIGLPPNACTLVPTDYGKEHFPQAPDWEYQNAHFRIDPMIFKSTPSVISGSAACQLYYDDAKLDVTNDKPGLIYAGEEGIDAWVDEYLTHLSAAGFYKANSYIGSTAEEAEQLINIGDAWVERSYSGPSRTEIALAVGRVSVSDAGYMQKWQELVDGGFIKLSSGSVSYEDMLAAASLNATVKAYSLSNDDVEYSSSNYNDIKNCDGPIESASDIPHGVSITINGGAPFAESESRTVKDVASASSIMATGFAEKGIAEAYDILADSVAVGYPVNTDTNSQVDYTLKLQKKDGTDWVAVEDAGAAGTYRLVITGMASSGSMTRFLYQGSASEEFTVIGEDDRISIADADLKVQDDQLVQTVLDTTKLAANSFASANHFSLLNKDGLTKDMVLAIYPDITLTVNGRQLEELVDYTIQVDEMSWGVGDPTVPITATIQGKGIYEGDLELRMDAKGLNLVMDNSASLGLTYAMPYGWNNPTSNSLGKGGQKDPRQNWLTAPAATSFGSYLIVDGVYTSKTSGITVDVDWSDERLVKTVAGDPLKTPAGTIKLSGSGWTCKAHWLFQPVAYDYASLFNVPSHPAKDAYWLYEGNANESYANWLSMLSSSTTTSMKTTYSALAKVIGAGDDYGASKVPPASVKMLDEIEWAAGGVSGLGSVTCDLSWFKQKFTELFAKGFLASDPKNWDGEVSVGTISNMIVPYDLSSDGSSYELYEDLSGMNWPANAANAESYEDLPHGAVISLKEDGVVVTAPGTTISDLLKNMTVEIPAFSDDATGYDLLTDSTVNDERDFTVHLFYGDTAVDAVGDPGEYKVEIQGNNSIVQADIVDESVVNGPYLQEPWEKMQAAIEQDNWVNAGIWCGNLVGQFYPYYTEDFMATYPQHFNQWGYDWADWSEADTKSLYDTIMDAGGLEAYMSSFCVQNLTQLESTALYMGTAEATFEVVSPASADDADAKTLADLISKVEERVDADSDLLRIAEGDSTSAVQHNGSYVDPALADALDSALFDAKGIMDGVNGVEGAAAVALSQVTAAKDALQQAFDAYDGGVKTAKTDEDVFGYVADALASASEAVESTEFGNADTRVALKTLIAKNDNGYYSASDTDLRASADECYALMADLVRAEAAHKAAEYVAPDPDQPEDPIVPDQPGDGDDDGDDNGDDNNGDNTENPDTPPVVEPDPIPEGYVITSTPVDNGAKMQLTAYDDGVAMDNVMFTTKDMQIAHIDENGLMTFVKPGIVDVTATITSGADNGKSFGIKVVSAYVDSSSDVDTQQLSASVSGASAATSASVSNLPSNEVLGLSASDKLELKVDALSTSTPTHSAYQGITGKNSYEVQLLLNGEPVHIGGALTLTLPVSLSASEKAALGNGRDLVVFHSINGSMVDHQVSYDSGADCVKLDVNHFSSFHVALVNAASSGDGSGGGSGDGSGSVALKDLSSAVITLGDSGPFALETDPLFADTLDASVTLDGETVPDSAYTLDFIDSFGNVAGAGGAIVAPGEYRLRATGIESLGYTGSVTSEPFTVTGNEIKVDLSKYGQVLLDNVSYAYTGDVIDYGYSVVLPDSGETLSLDRDYTAKLMYQPYSGADAEEVSEARDIGYYQIVATGIEDAGFTGSTSATFAVSYDYYNDLPYTGTDGNSGGGSGTASGSKLPQTGDEVQTLLALVSLVIASAAAAGAATIYRRKNRGAVGNVGVVGNIVDIVENVFKK